MKNVNVEQTIISSTERMVDDNLNFTENISDVCTKTSRQLNILQCLQKVIDYKSRMAIYKSLTMSNFNYCLMVWMLTSKKSIGRIENIKKTAHFGLCWTITNQVITIW